jgi:hypothetical protein
MLIKFVDRFIRSLTTLPCLSALRSFDCLVGELDCSGLILELRDSAELSFDSRVESNRAFDTRYPGRDPT